MWGPAGLNVMLPLPVVIKLWHSRPILGFEHLFIWLGYNQAAMRKAEADVAAKAQELLKVSD